MFQVIVGLLMAGLLFGIVTSPFDEMTFILGGLWIVLAFVVFKWEGF
jgi:F0F1-type ATP synthase assembly protein I